MKTVYSSSPENCPGKSHDWLCRPKERGRKCAPSLHIPEGEESSRGAGLEWEDAGTAWVAEDRDRVLAGATQASSNTARPAGPRVRRRQPLVDEHPCSVAGGTEHGELTRGQRAPNRGYGADGLSHPHGSWTPVPSSGGALAVLRKWQLSTHHS